MCYGFYHKKHIYFIKNNMKNCVFKGVGTAIITPFDCGCVDYVAFGILIERQIRAGADAIIVLGTTGEPCTVSEFEREQIITYAIKKVNGKAKVIVGCGANNTALAQKHYVMAQKLGADGALIVTPYYNKCTQEGLIEHYSAISAVGDLPIIVYNVSARTGVNILPETMQKLCEIKNVCGVKEASGNIGQILEYFRLVGDKIAIYCGEDALNGIFMLLGGAGVISVASNIVPALVKKVCDLSKKSVEEMNKLQMNMQPLIRALFLEVNPIPAKAGLAYLGMCKNELRLPLTNMTDKNFDTLKAEIDKLMELENDCC